MNLHLLPFYLVTAAALTILTIVCLVALVVLLPYDGVRWIRSCVR